MKTTAATLIVLALICVLHRPAVADEFQDHVDHATALMQGEQYKAALDELNAAYALRQSPRLLYEIGKAQQRLGNAQEAIAAYERFLAADPGTDPALSSTAREQLNTLQRITGASQPLAPQAPAVPSVPVHLELRTNAGLMAGGAVLFGASYLAAIITGSLLLGDNSSSSCSYYYNSSCSAGSLSAASGTLLIPFAGPLIASVVYREPYWSIPWALVDGVGQAGGLAMMIYAAKHPKRVPIYGTNFHLAPYGGAGTAGLVAVGRF